jgi:hypothetical protein
VLGHKGTEHDNKAGTVRKIRIGRTPHNQRNRKKRGEGRCLVLLVFSETFLAGAEAHAINPGSIKQLGKPTG